MYRHCRLKFKQNISKVNRNFKAECSSEATIQLESKYLLHNLDNGPSESITLKKQDAIKLFRKMDNIRRFENGSAQMYREKAIRGFCHLYSGQEAVGTGITDALRPQDTLITAYRCHGIAYLMGATVEEVLCELTGRRSGNARGKGGSMHMYTETMYGGNGIVGSHVPVGTGLAFARKYMGKEGIGITMYGDGAANQGQCFEAFNMAQIFKIPIVYVCENNLFGLGTFCKRAAANTKYYTRCEYIPGICIDGMDVLAVREGMRFAIDFATKSNGPIIIECITYRYFGHSMSDPGTSYRKRKDIEEAREKRDCLKKMKNYLLSANLVTPEEIKAIEAENKKLIAKAIEFAKTDNIPPLDELNTDVYVKAIEPLIRNVSQFNPLPHKNSNKFPLKL